MAATKNTTNDATKNTAPHVAADGIPTNFGDWVEERTGFAPYWSPTEGGTFVGKIVDKDESAEDFVRYMVQAGHDLECQRGPADGAESVQVAKGDFFTISVYSSLQPLFDLYLESKLSPWMQVMADKKLKTSTPGRQVWSWKVKVSPKDKAMLDSYRATNRVLAPKTTKSIGDGDDDDREDTDSRAGN